MIFTAEVLLVLWIIRKFKQRKANKLKGIQTVSIFTRIKCFFLRIEHRTVDTITSNLIKMVEELEDFAAKKEAAAQKAFDAAEAKLAAAQAEYNRLIEEHDCHCDDASKAKNVSSKVSALVS